MTFSGKFFLSKVPEFFAYAFQLSRKTFPCIFLAGLHFVSEKKEDNLLLVIIIKTRLAVIHISILATHFVGAWRLDNAIHRINHYPADKC